ncbi:MAG TPA: SIS domain-containing protein [Euryarchaeota archaeon]|nr:SIS domain-containing protein [Thermoplasmatales archaeon]PMP73373.1 MAG: phosphoheptose isomerase [Aciduliprofundum sp.]HEU12779.1 SIS domain-containing protein [Euryarchaeota archaeon]
MKCMDEREIDEYLKEGCRIRNSLDIKKISYIGNEITKALEEGKKIILMGNGGSAADAQHIAAELVGKFERERRPLPAIVLHGNTSTITAIGNDYGYEYVFERQIEAFAREGDIVIALSTSGNSENVLRGIKRAREMGAHIFGITGRSGGKMAQLVDEKNLIRIDSDRTPLIQEATITVGHILSKIIEDNIS